jgi:hypothetical protein
MTNVPGSAGQAITVRYQARRKPAAAASGKCHIFATRAALPAPKAVSPSQVDVVWPPAADTSTVVQDFVRCCRDNSPGPG